MLLVRHAHTNAIGQFLAGRAPGVELSREGAAQLRSLRAALSSTPIHAVYSSPFTRAMQTAEAIAAAHRLGVMTCDGLVEVDFGDWTGKAFEDLECLPAWRRYNTERASATVPGGESPRAVQARVVTTLEEIRRVNRDRIVAVVSHAEVIRAAVLHYLGVSLNLFHRFEIAPASVTEILLSRCSAQVVLSRHADALLDRAGGDAAESSREDSKVSDLVGRARANSAT